MSQPVSVDDKNFEQVVIKAAKPVVVDFWAEWCAPCRMMAPVIEELAKELAGRVEFAKLNVDHNPQTASRYSIMSIPTLILFKDGKPIKQWVGFRPKAELQKLLEEEL